MKTPKNQSEWKCRECGSGKKTSEKEVCHKCYMRKWLKTDKGQKWINKWIKYNSPNHSKNVSKYEKKNKDKVNAKQKAREQIPIPIGQLCQRCDINPATERHHRDYSKPLMVLFLCKSCHVKADMERRENGK